MIKRFIALILSCSLLLTACAPQITEQTSLSQEQVVSESAQTNDEPPDEEPSSSVSVASEVDETIEQSEELTFDSLSDPDLLAYLEDDVYAQLVEEYDSDEYFIENVSAIYISKEYLEEIAFNSQENVFFGYALSEIHEQFDEGSFVFTLDENNQTVVTEFEEYDDTYEKVLTNVAIGTGIILLSITIKPLAVTLPAVKTIFAVSSKIPINAKLSSSLISTAQAGVFTALQTGDFDESLKSASLVGSEKFAWAAFSGFLKSGAK